MEDIQIEGAAPEDAAAMADLIYSSGPKAFDYVFGAKALGGKRMTAKDYLLHAAQRRNGQYSHRNHVLVRRNGTVLGSMFNYDNRGLSAMYLPTIMSVIGFFRWRIWGVAKRSNVIDQVIKPPADDLLVVAHLAVAPEAQGLGIGSKLIDYAAGIAKEHGYAGLALDVSMENPAAQRLYERLGFEVCAERLSPIDEVPGHRYMEWRFS
ncbi:N-acetyltransferase [uncultured Pseudoteredinibacter sp.]|uniref:GNAT family N-acetyltransferase n=1 Tax=uncultured Pseudoteredinibacter sp. TaxID=1641701 RepID=UPI002630A380|nr:N-acetyltransferase [uncultured Pseudoteredinibacter sp.]